MRGFGLQQANYSRSGRIQPTRASAGENPPGREENSMPRARGAPSRKRAPPTTNCPGPTAQHERMLAESEARPATCSEIVIPPAHGPLANAQSPIAAAPSRKTTYRDITSGGCNEFNPRLQPVRFRAPTRRSRTFEPDSRQNGVHRNSSCKNLSGSLSCERQT